jgi:2'-5' RNA ligase
MVFAGSLDQMKRLFIAANFTTEVRDAIAAAIGDFPVQNPPWRWAHRDTWHVTLKFLGDTRPEDVDPIARCLHEVCSRHNAFPLSLGSLGGFPNISRPRVLFYAVESGKEALTQLAVDIDLGLNQSVGIPKESKKFRAHATVARIKKPLPKPIADKLALAGPLTGVSQIVSSVDLMQSELTPKGAIYTRVKEFALPQAS